jgi:hypothetical protein
VKRKKPMSLGDKISIGIVIFCVVLGALGAFRWFLHLFAGAVFGLLILVCIGLLVDNPRFDEVSRGIFKEGVVISYIKKQITVVQDVISRSDTVPLDNDSGVSAHPQKNELIAREYAYERFRRDGEVKQGTRP